MVLSHLDIKRIMKAGYYLDDFMTRTEEGWQLKNRSGRCFFLSEGGCRIYPHRPEGCRLYPLVYDESLGKAVLDELCPYRSEFEVSKDEVRRLDELLERLGKEKRRKNSEP
jgi:Fe-S-cluster containining protein